jgi:hypothetical protein
LVLQEEKERQLAKVKERVTQVRYERTLTMAPDASTSQGGKSFSKLLTEEEKRLNLDEQMTTAAQRMQDTFIRKAEEEATSPTTEKATLQVDSVTKPKSRSVTERLKERKHQRQAKRVSNTLQTTEEETHNNDN